MNKVLIMGNLSRDVELRKAGTSSVANVGIAINEKFKAKDGTYKESTTFVDCESWGSQAENLAKHLGKGSRVMIEGRLKLDSWDDKTSGQKRYKLKVVIEECHFIDRMGKADQVTQSPKPTSQRNNQTFDEELPL